MSQKKLAAALRWAESARVLAEAKDAERRERDALFADCFPEGVKGTAYVELPGGYRLKAVQRSNYKLDPAETRKAEAKLKAKPNGVLLADRLLKWAPEISIREYLKLPAELAKLFGKALTISPAAPSLELIKGD